MRRPCKNYLQGFFLLMISTKAMKDSILEEIRDRGGLMGSLAETYFNDEGKSEAFILYCFEQCHNKAIWDLWGKELILEIIHFRITYLRLQFSLLYSQGK